ncbi:MAG: dihydroorotate dehydrogenase electron transfer subunit [Syntrophomonadaceae bacterium]|jgi:dihydroorotate dehydrogenase electron transfer subunit|nr:dihydroorotate dehydrogenase electron transfer subunit [Syntrophomonadaceae bacterium]MDH7496854.1 dihydroorotate dehydrogenase electron transfer subunit [Syntrophomonadaceae bacterium]
MRKIVEHALIIRHREIVPTYFELEFIAPDIARQALPGQFVHLRVTRSLDPLLRRPFGIYNVEQKIGSVTVFYRVVGRGTAMLSDLHTAETVDVLGPLGNTFSIPSTMQRAVVVGGGVGIAPLVYLARVLAERKVEVMVLLGASTAGFLVGRDILKRLGVDYMVATDDGSEGLKGHVTELLERMIDRKRFDYIYACGPEPMMVKVTEIAQQNGIPGELSLEEHMACGIGACLGCAKKVRRPADGQDVYAKVCTDGPVFRIGEVVFNA